MEFLSTHGVARLLQITPDGVRHLERTGQLTAIRVELTPGRYQRIFLSQDVERLQRLREAKATKKAQLDTSEPALASEEEA